MKKGRVFLGLFAILFVLNLVSASSYQLTYTQLEKDIIVKENINGLSSTITLEADLEKSGDNYYFVKKIAFPGSFDEARIVLNLDYGFIVEYQKAYPSGYKIESDGETISLVWDFKNVNSGQEVAVFVTLKDIGKEENFISWIIAVLIVISGIWLYFKLKKTNKVKLTKDKSEHKTKINPATSAKYDYLLDTEKRVIEELKKADRNELWQKQIQNATGYSKAKVSRLVRNLESRALVVKIPFGNTNKVRLK